MNLLTNTGELEIGSHRTVFRYLDILEKLFVLKTLCFVDHASINPARSPWLPSAQTKRAGFPVGSWFGDNRQWPHLTT